MRSRMLAKIMSCNRHPTPGQGNGMHAHLRPHLHKHAHARHHNERAYLAPDTAAGEHLAILQAHATLHNMQFRAGNELLCHTQSSVRPHQGKQKQKQTIQYNEKMGSESHKPLAQRLQGQAAAPPRWKSGHLFHGSRPLCGSTPCSWPNTLHPGARGTCGARASDVTVPSSTAFG